MSAVIASNCLNAAEQNALRKAERIIQEGIKTFFEVGNALAKVREGKLYREHYANFEDYCRTKWHFSDRRARQLIDAAVIAENVQTGTIVPVSESQVRPLAKLEPEQQRAVWKVAQGASGGAQPTAKEVKSAVAIVLQKSIAPSVLEKPKSANSSRLAPYISTNGLQYADMAISQLEKIQPHDSQRGEALLKVIRWAAAQARVQITIQEPGQ